MSLLYNVLLLAWSKRPQYHHDLAPQIMRFIYAGFFLIGKSTRRGRQSFTGKASCLRRY